MSDERQGVAPNAGYLVALMGRALRAADATEDEATRGRAQARIARFAAAIEGMANGTISVGSRTPVADTPAWATLEVVTGGFATGALLAGGPLQPHERAKLAAIQAMDAGWVARFSSERAALNAWFLTDEGLAELRAMLEHGTYRIAVPEEGALLVLAWLLAHGEGERATDVLEAIAPFFDRLRFYPIPDERPLSDAAIVCVESAHAVASALSKRSAQRHVVAMNATFDWNALFDRLVELLSRSVSGAPLTIARDEVGAIKRDATGNLLIDGGVVGQNINAPWAVEARALVGDIDGAIAVKPRSKRLRDPNESFGTLERALRDLVNGQPLGARERHVRRVLGSVIAKRGAPRSPALFALREAQARVRALPLHRDIAAIVAARLMRVERDRGVSALEPYVRPVADREASASARSGAAVPGYFARKLARALESSIDDLVGKGVISSGEMLAIVAPQITSHVRATSLSDRPLRLAYAAIDAAFRRRRSLLLLDLASQVKLAELPWIAAIEPQRARSLDATQLARQTMEQLATLTIRAFPSVILPNKLLSELSTLVKPAGLDVPIVEELASDIFMGTFSEKYLSAAKIAATMLRGTLYERYYGLPFDRVLAMRPSKGRLGGVEEFAALCHELAGASASDRAYSVARNGTIIEQQQLLTTHNLAPLFDAFASKDKLGEAQLVEMASECVDAIVKSYVPDVPLGHAQLIRLKNNAYAWRQMVFFLSLVSQRAQRAFVEAARAKVAAGRGTFPQDFAPAIEGLALAVEGGAFGRDGSATHNGQRAQRFLGWTTGQHWLFTAKR